jgi:4'-phosphopantetheinyl transferase
MEPTWNALTKLNQIEKGTVHIWRVHLDLPTLGVRHLEEKLSMDEKIRAGRFRFEPDRTRFIAAHGVLRLILGRYLNVEPNLIRICCDKNGKPKVVDKAGKETIFFNLSHSMELGLYGFCRDFPIGVDIERIRDFPERVEVAEHFFSSRENDFLKGVPEGMRLQEFYRCWVLKEAVMKALGDGLSYPLNAFDVSRALGEQAGLLLRAIGKESRFSTQVLQVGPGFTAAFALRGKCRRVHCWQWYWPRGKHEMAS